jgi:hypothetical protein
MSQFDPSGESAPQAPAPFAARRGERRLAGALALCAFAAGLAIEAGATTPAGLRGTTAGPSAPATAPETADAFLSRGVWRAGACAGAQNFQAFKVGARKTVEVGAGKTGQGERLDVLRLARAGDMLEVETRVCAPVGCNRTFEQYRVLSPDTIQEWRFEGRLPDQPPYVLVADGRSTDGSGAGRVFNRCAE